MDFMSTNNDEAIPEITADLLNAKQVARRLGVTEGSLSQMRFHSRGPAYVKLGRAVRYREVDIVEYINRSVRATVDAQNPVDAASYAQSA